MSPRRKHSKISRLPKEIRDVVNDLLVKEDATIDQIVAKLRELGVQVGRSSVGRYSKDFAATLQLVRECKDQARTVVEAMADRPATEMHEAANQILVQEIFETLVNNKGMLAEADPVQVGRLLTTLQRSAVWNERLKLTWQKEAQARMEKAAQKVKALGKKEGMSAEALKLVREEIYGIFPKQQS